MGGGRDSPPERGCGSSPGPKRHSLSPALWPPLPHACPGGNFCGVSGSSACLLLDYPSKRETRHENSTAEPRARAHGAEHLAWPWHGTCCHWEQCTEPLPRAHGHRGTQWAAPRWDVTLRPPGLSPGTAPSRCRHSAIAVLCRAGVRAGAHPQACPGPCVGPHPAQCQPLPLWGQTRVTGVSSTGTSLCGRRGLCLISVCLTQVLRGEQPSLAHHPSPHRQDRNGRPGLSWDPRQSRFCSSRR